MARADWRGAAAIGGVVNMIESNSTLPPWVGIASNALRGLTHRNASARRADLPYCVHGTMNPDVRCVVNRNYRTIGAAADTTWSDYESSIGWHVSHAHFELLRRAGVVSGGGYFFNDGNPPWDTAACLRAYREKLETLLAPWAVMTRGAA